MSRARSSAWGALAGVLLVALGAPAGEAATIGRVTAGGDGQSVVVEVTASEPLGYALVESSEPFTLSVLFADASFGFPDTRRDLDGEGLATIETRTVSREGGTLARLDLTFTRTAPYSVTREGTQVQIRAEVAGPAAPIVIGEPAALPAPAPPPARAEPVATPALPRPAGARSVTENRPADVAGARTPAPPAQPAPKPPSEVSSAAVTPSSEPAELRAVRPQSGRRGAEVMLEITGSPAVKTSVRTRPDRLVIDLENARFAKLQSTLRVGGRLLQGVRISQHTRTGVRVVCDLARPAPFRVDPVAGGLRVRLGGAVR